MTVVLTPTANLNVRSGPGQSHPILRTVLPGQRLESLETPAETLAKVGQQGQWLHVALPGGGDAYTAAWLVEVIAGSELAPPPAPAPAVPDDPALVTVTPTAAMNLRAGPDTTYTVVGGAQPGDPLESLEHRDVTFAKVGQQGQWLNIRLPDGRAAWAGAWLLEIVQDVVAPVTAAPAAAPVEPEPEAAFDLPALDALVEPGAAQPQEAAPVEAAPAEPEPEAAFDLPALDALVEPETAQPQEAAPVEAAPAEPEPEAAFDLPALEALVEPEAAQPQEAAPVEAAPAEPEPEAAFDLPALDDLVPLEPAPVKTVSPAAPVILTPTAVLNVRSGPGLEHGVIAVAQPGDRLTALESRAEVLGRIGQPGQFIHVQLSDGRDAYTAAWVLAVVEEAPPALPEAAAGPAGDSRQPIEIAYPMPPPLHDQQVVPVVTPTDALNARSGPDTAYGVVAVARPGERLISLEAVATTRAKVGQMREWLHVRLPDGREAYTAAWLLAWLAEEVQQVAPPPSAVRLTAPEDTNVRSGPGEQYRIVGGFFAGEAVTALEPDAVVAARIGGAGQWLRVQLPNNRAGWAAAWCLQLTEAEPTAPTVTDEVAAPAPADILAAPAAQAAEAPPPVEAAPVEEPPAGEMIAAAEPAAALIVAPPAAIVAVVETAPQAVEAAPAALEAEAAITAVAEEAPQGAETAPAEPVAETLPAGAPEVVLLTPTTTGLSIRNGPSTDHDRLAGTLNPGDRLQSLEEAASSRAKVGVNGQWLNVKLTDGRAVYVAAWLVKEVRDDELPAPPPRPGIGRREVALADRALTLTPKGVSELNLRGGPGSAFAVAAVARPGEPLEVLEAAAVVEEKIKTGQNWVFVRTTQGVLGWAAAWLVDVLAKGLVSGAERPVIQLPDPADVPTDPDEGRKRALDFYHDPCFVSLPVCNPAEVGSFSGFGPNNFSYRIRDKDLYGPFGRLHNGLDFGVPIGTMLCAMDWGIVLHVSAEGVEYDNPYRAGPYSIIIRHADTLVLYGHMNGARQGVDMFVKEGDIVQPGQKLGRSGTFNQFPHLHIEMRRIPADYIERLRTLAQAAGGDLLEAMDKQFRQRGLLGWIQPQDTWLNMACCFNPPLESYWQQYGWAHAASEKDADKDNDGFVDRVVLGGHSVPIAYDLYTILSIPPGTSFNFWAGSRTV